MTLCRIWQAVDAASRRRANLQAQQARDVAAAQRLAVDERQAQTPDGLDEGYTLSPKNSNAL